MESELFRDLSELLGQFLVDNVEVLLYFRGKKVARYVFCWISTMKTVWKSGASLASLKWVGFVFVGVGVVLAHFRVFLG